nr:hypothetical protein CFP56_70266 [Quercus suber]
MILAYCLAVSKLILQRYDSGMVPCHVETDFEAARQPKAGRRNASTVFTITSMDNEEPSEFSNKITKVQNAA